MSTVSDLAIRILAQTDQALAGLKGVEQAVERVEKATGHAGGQAAASFDQFDQKISSVKKSVEDTGAMLKSGAFILAGAAITSGVTVPIIELGREAVLMADKLRQSEIAFTTMLGSADKAKVMLGDLRAFAAATPFEFPELVQAAKKMLALGFSAEQIVPNLRVVGDAVAGLGGNAGVFDRVILALGQMQAKGQVMSQEMRQLAEAGIPAWDILAGKLGVTVPEAMDMVTKKAVDAATGVTAIMQGMGQRFGGLMEEQSKTIQGTMANIKDTVGFIMTDIGSELITTLRLTEVLGAVQSFARGFLDWFRQLDEGTKQIALVIAAVFAAGGPILVAVGACMLALSVITAPLLIGGAIVAGIIAGAALILLNWTSLKDGAIGIWTGLLSKLTGVWEELKGVGIVQWTSLKVEVLSLVQAMVTGIGNVLAKLGAIFDGVKAKTEMVKGFFKGLYDAVVGHSYIPDMVEEIGHHMENLDVAMTAPARNATVNTGLVIEGATASWASTINQFASTLNFGWGSVAQTVGSSLAQMTTQAVNWGQVMTNLGVQVLGQLITTAIQVGAQWFLTLSGVAKAFAGTETAKTAIATTEETARMVIATSSAKAMNLLMIGNLNSLSAVATAALAIAFAVAQVVAGIAYGAAAIMAATPFGQPAAGALIVATTGFEFATAASIVLAEAAIQAALGSAIVAGSVGAAIPAFAGGGAVFGPTLALVGEKASRSNPEFIGHGDQLGLGGGGQQTIIIEVDGREFARKIMQHMPGIVYMKTGLSS